MFSIEFVAILRRAMTEQRALGDACLRSVFLEHYCLSLSSTNVFECKLLSKGFMTWSVGKTKTNICINKGWWPKNCIKSTIEKGECEVLREFFSVFIRNPNDIIISELRAFYGIKQFIKSCLLSFAFATLNASSSAVTMSSIEFTTWLCAQVFGRTDSIEGALLIPKFRVAYCDALWSLSLHFISTRMCSRSVCTCAPNDNAFFWEKLNREPSPDRTRMLRTQFKRLCHCLKPHVYLNVWQT